MRNPIKNAWHSLLHNRRHLIFAIYRRIPWIIPDDELYLKIYYWLSLRKPLNLNSPYLFNEKLQWLKLNDRRSEYTMMADKNLVKQYVARIIGPEYVVPCLGVWDSPKSIDWDTLPEQFVLKTNHDGGGNGIVICNDKSKINKKKAIKELRRSLNRNTFMIGREWPYKNIKKKIIAEKYLEDNKYGELRDYKFFCFNGTPKLLYVASERGKKDRANFDFFDMAYNHLNISNGHPLSRNPLDKPQSFELMKELAVKLSRGIPFIRIDFYEVNGKPYFGEFTFYHLGGTGTFEPSEWDKILGEWITLPLVFKTEKTADNSNNGEYN